LPVSSRFCTLLQPPGSTRDDAEGPEGQGGREQVEAPCGTAVVWQTETTGLTVAPPPSGVLERDVPYEWQVEAIDREGSVRMTSPP
jgi:hypothetical protein